MVGTREVVTHDSALSRASCVWPVEPSTASRRIPSEHCRKASSHNHDPRQEVRCKQTMSSHREAPEISKDPVADNADLYAFVSPDNPGTVTIIANYVPLQLPAGGPNFYEFGDDVLYKVHIDNDGDALAGHHVPVPVQHRAHQHPARLFLYNTGPITHLNDEPGTAEHSIRSPRSTSTARAPSLATDLACPPCNVGQNSIPDYAPLTAEAVHPLGSGSNVFAGQRADGFYVDLGSIFDLGDLRPFQPDFLLKGAAVAGSTRSPGSTSTPSRSRSPSGT